MPTPIDECMLGDALEAVPPEVRIIFGTFVLSHAIEERMDEFNTTPPLSKPERRILINLGVPRRMGQIAETLNTQPSAVTAIADLLEDKGLALRERDPNDRRAWQMRLTEAGVQARREMMETTVRVFREITGLSEDDIGQLAAQLDKVAIHILKTGFPKGLAL